MLNENVYNSISKEQSQAKKITSEREKIRNNFIDKMGRKPTEEEINVVLTQKVTSGVV